MIVAEYCCCVRREERKKEKNSTGKIIKRKKKWRAAIRRLACSGKRQRPRDSFGSSAS
jgi:hypothetical protein